MPNIYMLKASAPDMLKARYAPGGNHSIHYTEDQVPEKDRGHFVVQNRDPRAVNQVPTAKPKPPRKEGDKNKGRVDNA